MTQPRPIVERTRPQRLDKAQTGHEIPAAGQPPRGGQAAPGASRLAAPFVGKWANPDRPQPSLLWGVAAEPFTLDPPKGNTMTDTTQATIREELILLIRRLADGHGLPLALVLAEIHEAALLGLITLHGVEVMARVAELHALEMRRASVRVPPPDELAQQAGQVQ